MFTSRFVLLFSVNIDAMDIKSAITACSIIRQSSKVSAVLHMGGYPIGSLRSAELYNPVTKASCSLPQLSHERYHHTQDGGLVCGGGENDETRKTCVKLSPVSGTWVQSHKLRHRRIAHVSWATGSVVYLIGGSSSSRTSEKVKVDVDNSVEEGFSLKYDTRSYSAYNYQHGTVFLVAMPALSLTLTMESS